MPKPTVLPASKVPIRAESKGLSKQESCRGRCQLVCLLTTAMAAHQLLLLLLLLVTLANQLSGATLSEPARGRSRQPFHDRRSVVGSRRSAAC